jgi:putative ABC transport system permease protein
MNGLWNDVHYALRQLRKSPGFTLTAVLTLGLGIGATTAIFSIVEGVLLRPLPYADQKSLVIVGDQIAGPDGADALPAPQVAAPEIASYKRDTRAFAGLSGYLPTYYEFSNGGEPAQLNASRLNAGLFPLLGVQPLLGRVFTQEEEETRQRVAVLSYQMWRSRFQSDAGALGKTILLDRKPYVVIGVMPREFEFPLVPGQLSRSEFWVPLSLSSSELENRGSWNLHMVGRLKNGVTPQQAEADAMRVTQATLKTFPGPMQNLKLRPVVERLDENTVASAKPLVRALFLAVTVVLFIACANLAGLLLVRVIRRRREMAVRLALGAGNAAVLRQNLIETLALSLSGGLLGLGLASVVLRIGVNFLPENLPRVNSISLDWGVVTFAIGLAVLTGLVCGVVPAYAASRTDINEGLKEGGRTGSAGGGHARMRSVLVIAEVAVALVLLVGAGLLLRSFEKIRSVQLGFQTDKSLTASYSLPRLEYSTQAAINSFNQQLMTKLRELPGVQSVGVTSQLPDADQLDSSTIFVEGHVVPKGSGIDPTWTSQLMGDYFQAAGIPLLEGRYFNDADRVDAPLVVIVNHTLAKHYWPGQSPIGKRVHWGLEGTPMPWMTVVGVIGDLKQSSADAPVQEQVYQPVVQTTKSYGTFAQSDSLDGQGGSIMLRTAMDPEQVADALRSVVRSIDPRLPLTRVESMQKVVEEGQAPRKFQTALISAFAGAAVLLALLGIYSVIAFSAALRTQEMAIRLALGSQRGSVMGLILASGAKLGLAGCGIGVVVAFFATRLLRSFLFEVDALDPAVLVLAAVSIFVLAMAASLIPARRVAMVEPVKALRGE